MGGQCYISGSTSLREFSFSSFFSGLLYFILPWCDGIFAYPPYHTLPFSEFSISGWTSPQVPCADCQLADSLKELYGFNHNVCLSNDCRTEMIGMYPTLSLDKFKTLSSTLSCILLLKQGIYAVSFYSRRALAKQIMGGHWRSFLNIFGITLP